MVRASSCRCSSTSKKGILLVEEHLSRHILEKISRAGRFEQEPGTGVAFQIDIEDVIGLGSQIETIEKEIEDQI